MSRAPRRNQSPSLEMHLSRAQMRLQTPAPFEAAVDLTALAVAVDVLIVAVEASEVDEASLIPQQMALELPSLPHPSQPLKVPGISSQQPTELPPKSHQRSRLLFLLKRLQRPARLLNRPAERRHGLRCLRSQYLCQCSLRLSRKLHQF